MQAGLGTNTSISTSTGNNPNNRNKQLTPSIPENSNLDPSADSLSNQYSNFLNNSFFR